VRTVEEVPLTCPSNLRWLCAMKAMLPEDIFRESRLGKYEGCLKEGSSEEKI